MRVIVIELASVWAVIEVDPSERLLATCQHKEYATHIANALEEFDLELIEAGIVDEPEPEPFTLPLSRCARCGSFEHAQVHSVDPMREDRPDGYYHLFEQAAGDLPKPGG